MTRPGSVVSLHKIQSKARGNVVKMSGMVLEKAPGWTNKNGSFEINFPFLRFIFKNTPHFSPTTARFLPRRCRFTIGAVKCLYPQKWGRRRREGWREGEKSGRTDSSTPSVSANAQKLLNRTARHRFLSTERSLLAAQNKQQIAH